MRFDALDIFYVLSLCIFIAHVVHTLGIRLVPEPSLNASDTLNTHVDILIISIKRFDALILLLLPILYLSSLDFLSNCMKK